jgi:hypothetical protein
MVRAMAWEGEGMEERDEMESPAAGEALEWPNAVTLVLAGRSARQRRWAATTAIEVARKLAGSRQKVIVADLDRRQPSALAEALGLAPGAGIVDVLFRGASFSTVARRPERESFFVLPLGKDPPPAHELFQHGRWRKIAARLADADAHLLPCVTGEDWLSAGPIPGFEACIVFNGAEVEAELPAGARQLAEFIAPPEIREETPASMSPESVEPDAEELETPERDEVAVPPLAEGIVEEEVAEPPADREGPAVPVEEPTEPVVEAVSGERRVSVWNFEEPATDEDAGEPPLAESRAGESVDDASREPAGLRLGRRRPSDRRGILIGAVAVIAVIGIVALWQVLGRESEGISEGGVPEARAPTDDRGEEGEASASRGDLERGEGSEAEGGAGSVEAAAGEGAEEPSPPPAAPLPYSVAIASYSSLNDAVERQRRWSRGDLTFYVAPTVVRGVVYYRVFGGILPDREQARRLMAELVRAGVKEEVNDWDVRPTRLAFSFGTYPSERDASAAVESLRGRGIPAYVVKVPAADEGGAAYQVYAGGYEKPADARPLQDRIAEAGLDAELVERVGMVPR